MSLPSRERGLKSERLESLCKAFCRSLRGSVDWNHIVRKSRPMSCVAPFAGAWIEILERRLKWEKFI